MAFEEWFGNPVGLVLNGGGGKGAYQIGAFKALREAGLHDMVTAVAGTSVGALNMCLFNYDDGEIGEEIWSHITPEQFVDPEFGMVLDGKEGMVSRQGLLDIIDGYMDLDKIRNNPLALYATVAEYDGEEAGKGVARYLKLNGCSNEEIKNILLASSCMPLIYEPVKMNGLTYRDGGLLDNLPMKPLYDLGIRKFIVVLLSKDAKVPVEQFPGSEFLIIRPSKDLGDLVTGTLDFTAKNAKVRMDLGYMDACRAIRYYKDEITNISEIEEIEVRRFDNQLRVDTAMDSANENMNHLKDLLKKYDI
ncbi:MAG: patatin-like phospholipase family protein [Lachnospiraceae bacterium]